MEADRSFYLHTFHTALQRTFHTATGISQRLPSAYQVLQITQLHLPTALDHFRFAASFEILGFIVRHQSITHQLLQYGVQLRSVQVQRRQQLTHTLNKNKKNCMINSDGIQNGLCLLFPTVDRPWLPLSTATAGRSRRLCPSSAFVGSVPSPSAAECF